MELTFLMLSPRRHRHLLLCLWMVLFSLTGCASLPEQVPRRPSVALNADNGSTLARLVSRSVPATMRAGQPSGFRLVTSGEEAFATLIALADSAERTLDLQYYIINDDNAVREIMSHVMRAARRGVRVRVLVDDLNTDGKDIPFLKFARHPNIEVRLFNPFPAGRFSKLTRFLNVVTDVRRINRRMHNKAFIADNALAMTGGRNLGAEYFLRDDNTNFVDLDVIVAGPAVQRLSAGFDAFWNSRFAFPVETLASDAPAAAASATMAAPPGRPRGEAVVTDAPDTSPVSAAAPVSAPPADRPGFAQPDREAAPVERPEAQANVLGRQIKARRLQLEWAPAVVRVDDPSKIDPDHPRDSSQTMGDELARMVHGAREEVILISPYFVPGERGVALIRQLVERGVRMRILTNSLAATDSPIVHVGYAKYRKPMLESKVELYELKANQTGIDPRASQRRGLFKSSQASLHVKAVVVDGSTLFTGSMNLDPRSVTQNTETGLFIPNRVLAQGVVKLFEESAYEHSYRVALDEHGGLRWIEEVGGREVVHTTEPETSFWKRWSIRLLGPITPEELL